MRQKGVLTPLQWYGPTDGCFTDGEAGSVQLDPVKRMRQRLVHMHAVKWVEMTEIYYFRSMRTPEVMASKALNIPCNSNICCGTVIIPISKGESEDIS